jgi:hypothetical protein
MDNHDGTLTLMNVLAQNGNLLSKLLTSNVQ